MPPTLIRFRITKVIPVREERAEEYILQANKRIYTYRAHVYTLIYLRRIARIIPYV